MNVLILSCSLSPFSNSAKLAMQLANDIKKQSNTVDFVDLREFDLPFCDASSCYENAQVQSLQGKLQAADAVIVAVPIYNYGVGGVATNLMALLGKAWTGKVVGFVCAAGGKSSYMSIMTMANALMLDFRCHIIPRFVYADRSCFEGDQIVDEQVPVRLAELAEELCRVAKVLA